MCTCLPERGRDPGHTPPSAPSLLQAPLWEEPAPSHHAAKQPHPSPPRCPGSIAPGGGVTKSPPPAHLRPGACPEAAAAGLRGIQLCYLEIQLCTLFSGSFLDAFRPPRSPSSEGSGLGLPTPCSACLQTAFLYGFLWLPPALSAHPLGPAQPGPAQAVFQIAIPDADVSKGRRRQGQPGRRE